MHCYESNSAPRGGIVAFEMARQLVAAGEQVAALVIFDTLAPTDNVNTGNVPAPIEDAKLLAEIAGILERHHGVLPSLTAEDLRALSKAARCEQ